jgi:hypothetical protein
MAIQNRAQEPIKKYDRVGELNNTTPAGIDIVNDPKNRFAKIVVLLMLQLVPLGSLKRTQAEGVTSGKNTVREKKNKKTTVVWLRKDHVKK